MRTLVVGDLHGQYEAAQAAVDTGDNVVFVGDYLDSFDRSLEDQITTLEYVLWQAESNDKVQALLGNHELSYLDPSMRCSGWEAYKEVHVLSRKERIEKFLKPYVWVQDVLVSHAGVSRRLLKELVLTLEEYLEQGNYNQIGAARGGWCRAGGLFWCDWHREMVPLPGVTQVVGHSHYKTKKEGKSVRKMEGSGKLGGVVYNVDNLGRSSDVLAVNEDGTTEVVTLKL